MYVGISRSPESIRIYVIFILLLVVNFASIFGNSSQNSASLSHNERLYKYKKDGKVLEKLAYHSKAQDGDSYYLKGRGSEITVKINNLIKKRRKGKKDRRDEDVESWKRPKRQNDANDGIDPQPVGATKPNPQGTLVKIASDANLTNYDVLVLDLLEEPTTSTTAAPTTTTTNAPTTTTAAPATTTTPPPPPTTNASSTTTASPTTTTTTSTTTTTTTTPPPPTPAPPDKGNETGIITINPTRPTATSNGITYIGDILDGIYIFFGIPYAAPPVSKLRFKRPFPPEPIIEKFDASKMNPPCFPTRHDRTSQSAVYSMLGTNPNAPPVAKEDCLYLNIWAPNSTVKPFPVLVWIHGEGFLSGINSEDYSTVAAFVKLTNMIVVSIQYRLGAFGFLDMNTPDAPGNMGLLDQIEALKWIDQNIEGFGGNSDLVTIMGHDIGSAFVGFHLLSKISPSFFKRAVMLGGAPTQPHVYKTQQSAFDVAYEFATELGCVNTNHVKSILECLMKVDAVSIWDIQSLFHSTGNNALAFSFVPTNDGHVLENGPLDLLESRMGKASQILIGGTSNEGFNMMLQAVEGLRIDKPSFISLDKLKRIISHAFRKFNEVEIAAILHEYKNWIDLEDGWENQIRLAEVFGDYYFTCPIRKFSDLWSARGLRTYYYRFPQKSSALKRSNWTGAVHGDEIDFFFGVPLKFPDKFSKDEVDVSKMMVDILTTFVKDGIPGITWERYGRETPHFLDLSSTSPSSQLGPRRMICSFWNDVFPLLRKTTSPVSIKPSVNSDTLVSIDDHCTITFSNCTRSNFAIYNGERGNI